jgi:hypothetical protein
MAASLIRTFRAPLAVAFLALVVLAALTVPASGHGGERAGARKPILKEGPLRLVGVGGYETDRRHAGGIRVTTCLERRYSGNFVAVRCNTSTSPGKRVASRVAVPGCVRGVWRTVAYGQAQNAAGDWRHPATDVSRRFRCP